MDAAPPHVEELNVLDPGWVTTAIYKLLNDSVLMQCGGIMDRKSMRRSLEELPDGVTRYPKSKDDFILAMMRRFEICLAFDGHQETWLLPDLLHEDEIESGDWTGALSFRYQYVVLPVSVIGRLMVRLHSFIDRARIWRTGAVFVQGNVEALVRSDQESAYMNILIRGGLAQERRAALSLIRGTLNSIHHSFSDKLGEKEQIPVPGNPTVFMNYQKLLLLESEGEEFEREVVDGKLIKIKISDVLNGISDSASRQIDKHVASKNGWPIYNVQGNFINNVGEKMTNSLNSLSIGGNVTNSQVGLDLTNCLNTISNLAEGERKDLLGNIAQETKAILAALPEAKKGEVAHVTENLELLVKQANSDNPNKTWYGVSAAGLLEAASWVKNYSGNIGETIDKLGKLIGFTS